MKEDVLRFVEICPICKVGYMPKNGEICGCQAEEPQELDWDEEDNPLVEAHKQ